jgi:hypothetical protein
MNDLDDGSLVQEALMQNYYVWHYSTGSRIEIETVLHGPGDVVALTSFIQWPPSIDGQTVVAVASFIFV